MKNKEIRAWLFILLLQITWIPLFACGPKTEYELPAQAIEEERELIHWKQECGYEEEIIEPELFIDI